MKPTLTSKLILLIFLPVLILCISCGSEYHLERAKHHLTLAGELGAKFKKDTIYKQVITPTVKKDTIIVFRYKDNMLAFDETMMDVLHDTIVVETTRWKTKTRIDTLHHTVYQQVECKSDTIRIPMEIDTTISGGSVRDTFKWISIAALLLLLIIIFARWKK